jgi:hypothetical protein
MIFVFVCLDEYDELRRRIDDDKNYLKIKVDKKDDMEINYMIFILLISSFFSCVDCNAQDKM